MTITDWLRQRLLQNVVSQEELAPLNKLSLNEIRNCQWSIVFEQWMKNRLMVGYFRYGPTHKQKKGQYDYLQAALDHINLYQQDGNIEHLVDVANLCLIEFVNGEHPKRCFTAMDDSKHAQRVK